MEAQSVASMVHHGGRRGLGSVDLRSAQLCSVSPPYVEKEIWCSFRDRGNPIVRIRPSLIAALQRPGWRNSIFVGFRRRRNARDGARTGQ